MKNPPFSIAVLIHLLECDHPVPVGVAATRADVPALLRRIADVWEAGPVPAVAAGGGAVHGPDGSPGGLLPPTTPESLFWCG